MIDVSQWRASIGLWYCCQAASGRPANGRHSHSFNAAVDNKSGSTTSGEKTSKLPAALSLIGFFLLLFHYLSLLRHILMIPLTGNCYQVQCTTGVTVTDTNHLQSVVLPVGSSSNLIHNDFYLIVCLLMLLLLSGDVESNPGPMIDDQPDIFLLLEWLEPLVDWKPFGLLLPGITQEDITTIEDFETDAKLSKEGLFCKWLKKNPTATWRDVLNALTKREEKNLLQTINDQLLQEQQHSAGTSENLSDSTNDPTEKNKAGPTQNDISSNDTSGNTDAPISTVPAVPTLSSSVSVMNKSTTSAPTKVPDSINGKPIAEGKKGSHHNTSGTQYSHSLTDTSSTLIQVHQHSAAGRDNAPSNSKTDQSIVPSSTLLAVTGTSTCASENLRASTEVSEANNDKLIAKGNNIPDSDNTPGDPKALFQSCSYKLVHAISVNLYNVTDALHAKDLIPQQAKEEMYVLGRTDKEKASKLVNDIETQLEVYADNAADQKRYLIKICHVLVNQQHRELIDIVSSILCQLGYSMPDVVTFHSSPPNDVQGFVDSMTQHYKHQPIVATDWPPRIGKDFFGRLALVEKQICMDFSTDVAKSAWHMLRGQIDKIYKLTETKMISIEDLLQPTDSFLSLRIVIDGPPGIGKTTLCRKLLNMWSNGTLAHQQYDLVLYCPLRNSKIAEATTLANLFEKKRYEGDTVVKWFEKRNGEGLLIIFDGWDELSEKDRKSSLAARIIYRKELDECSVIVTSRSYASSSLLELPNLSRHVQVIGFSEEEISTVIIQTIQKDTKVAQDILKYLQCKEKSGNDSESKNGDEVQLPVDKDSQLAVKLVRDLEVRNDVRSLCYMPLVCSMVILVYRKEGGHLPTTLTQLYENFILQTIRRHVKKHDIDPHTLGSLSLLPSQFAKPLQELCQLAYTSLADTKMTFSSYQVQSLSEAVKEEYLGLLTAFIEYDEVKYQFLHLSIQEFLAAWWIAKHAQKTEKVFKDHFDDDHFRMCLRFVAGLTHLEHESYQQYFNIQQLDLQCKNAPVYISTDFHHYYLFLNPEIIVEYMNAFHMRSNRTKNFDNVPILLLQLLYESQNIKLCPILAKSIKNYSLCLHSSEAELLSLFDWMCLSYFINNSNTSWNHLHFGVFSNKKISIFTAGQTNKSLQAHRLAAVLEKPTDELIYKLLQPSLLHNIQECYCDINKGQYVPCLVLIEFLNLPQLTIFHIKMFQPTIPTIDNTYYAEKCSEIEKCIAKNSKIKQMMIQYYRIRVIHSLISVMRGVARNKTMKSLAIRIHDENNISDPLPLPDGVIEQLLKDNNTLQTLVLVIPNERLPSLNVVEVNTPLTALDTGWSSKLATLLLPHIKGLHCLSIFQTEPYLPMRCGGPPHLIFLSHPNLRGLILTLYTAESAIELFTILQTNTTLEALSVSIMEFTSSMGTSLQDMLTQNQTLTLFDIWNDNPLSSSSCLSFLISGLRNNTSLKRLVIPIPLNEEGRAMINVISQKNNLTELDLKLRLDQSYSSCSEEEKEQIMTPLFYEQLLPAVTDMLQSHTTIKRLVLILDLVKVIKEASQPNWKEIVQHLYETIFTHPSLECVYILAGFPSLLTNTLDDLIDRLKKEQPHKQMPILEIN